MHSDNTYNSHKHKIEGLVFTENKARRSHDTLFHAVFSGLVRLFAINLTFHQPPLPTPPPLHSLKRALAMTAHTQPYHVCALTYIEVYMRDA
ncbi:hypothetical protein ACTXT7_014241 [Hymenolepis weldensis]